MFAPQVRGSVMNVYRWTVRVALGGVTLLALFGFVRRRCPHLQLGDCRRSARGVGANRHDDRAVHHRCRMYFSYWDGLGRNGPAPSAFGRCLISGLHLLLGHRAAKGGAIETPIMSCLWVMNDTAGTAAAPWFQLVVPKTVVKSWRIPCKKPTAPLVGGGRRRQSVTG